MGFSKLHIVDGISMIFVKTTLSVVLGTAVPLLFLPQATV